MPSYHEARKIILEHVSVLPAETVPLREAVGRVLAADVAMPWDLPGWDHSAMDGFAVRSADCTGPVTLRVRLSRRADAIAVSPAEQGRLEAGHQVRVQVQLLRPDLVEEP